MPSGPVTAAVTHQATTLHLELWGNGADELVSQIGDQLGISMPLLGEEAAELPRQLMRLKAAGLRRTQRGSNRTVETLVPIVLQQLVTWREAAASWRSLLMEYGSKAPGPHELRCPPSLDTLAHLSLPDYRRLGVAAKRAKTIQAVCGAMIRYQDSPLEKQQRAILSVPGIGPWTTEFYKGLELGDPDAVPTGDYHLPSTVAWALKAQRQATDMEMLELLQPFRGFRFDILRLIMGANISVPRRNPRMPQRRVRN